MTTPALAQTPVATSATPGTSLNATYGSAVTPGNVLVVFGSAASSSQLAFSDPTNGSYFKAFNSLISTTQMAIAIVQNTGNTALTVTMTSSANVNLRLEIHEWSGLETTNLSCFTADQSISANGTSATPSAGTFPTLAEAGELVLAFAQTGSTTSTWTAGSGFALSGANNPAVRQVEYKVVSDTTGPTAQFTIDASRAWTACAIALRSAKNRKVIALTSGGSFAAPSDWPGTADRVDLIGGGGAGHAASGATQEGIGGGGGAYTYIYNLAIPNGAAMQIGQGGATSGADGTNTWIISTSTAFAALGHGGGINGPGTGGLASTCIPSANAQTGGNSGNFTNNATCGAVGGGGAAGPFGGGGFGGNQAAGVSGGTGGGGGGGGTAGGAQSAANQAGTNGGNGFGPFGGAAGTGGTGGASGTNNGNNGTFASPAGSGGGGGGGGSNGSGGGGGGGIGGGGSEFNTGSQLVGSGGGGGGTGQITSGSSPSPGAGGNYGGGGGGGGGAGTFTGFGAGAPGLIVITYTPAGIPQAGVLFTARRNVLYFT